MILNTLAERLKRRSRDDFRGRHPLAWRGPPTENLVRRMYPPNPPAFLRRISGRSDPIPHFYPHCVPGCRVRARRAAASRPISSG